MADDRREKEELQQRRQAIDLEIIALLAKRARLSADWAKSHPDRRAVLPSTTRASIDALASGAVGDMPPESIRSIFREVFAACRALEAPVRVVYTGAAGAFGHAIAERTFGASSVLEGVDDAARAVDEVAQGRADFAVLPYETSAEGPVLATLLAISPSDLKVVAVEEIPTGLPLLTASGTLDNIKTVYLTASAHGVTHDRLLELLPDAQLVEVATAVEACRRAAESPEAAAVALPSVGARDHLAVASRSLAPETKKRFCIVSMRPASRTGKDATGILFTVSDEPGALFEVLRHFAERSVNLRKIHSRPAEAEGWQYLFFLEVSGHVTDRNVVTAVEGAKQNAKTWRILGSYPATGP
jgi:chorismate mutase / prephenate dehydratase